MNSNWNNFLDDLQNVFGFKNKPSYKKISPDGLDELFEEVGMKPEWIKINGKVNLEALSITEFIKLLVGEKFEGLWMLNETNQHFSNPLYVEKGMIESFLAECTSKNILLFDGEDCIVFDKQNKTIGIYQHGGYFARIRLAIH